MKTFFQKYRHAWVFLYGLIYFPWFFYLEKTVTHNYSVIQTSLDTKIPFIEFFIIPYLFWFAFMIITVMYFFLKDRTEFYRLASFLIIGMTVFLIISTLWPNGQNLRPTHFARDNIFVDMVKNLYTTDTPTNVFPSIHVYNTVGCFIAVHTSVHLKNIKWVQITTFVITSLIILSTMFLKQHSFIDAIGAGLFALVAYVFIYGKELRNVHTLSRQPI